MGLLLLEFEYFLDFLQLWQHGVLVERTSFGAEAGLGRHLAQFDSLRVVGFRDVASELFIELFVEWAADGPGHCLHSVFILSI